MDMLLFYSLNDQSLYHISHFCGHTVCSIENVGFLCNKSSFRQCAAELVLDIKRFSQTRI